LVDDRKRRLATMSQRFQDRSPGKQSIYIDRDQWKAANNFCKEVMTMLYVHDGLDAKKFDVHEEVFAFAAEHREELIARLRARLTELR